MKLTHAITEGGRRKQATILVLAALVLTVAAIGVVVAQDPSEDTFTDDFEDGDASDWVNQETEIEAQTSTTAIEGDTSLHVATSQLPTGLDSATFEWEGGPELSMTEDFHASGVFYPDLDDGAGIRIGIAGDNQFNDGENAFLIFEPDETFLATSTTQEPDGGTLEPFDDTWVRFRFMSSEDSTTVRAKVWEYGTAEPLNWQMNRTDFDSATSGNFGVNAGQSQQSGSRHAYMDSVSITGTPFVPSESENLELDTPTLVKPGDSGSYSVRFYGPNNRSQIVTGEANVTSGNESILTVNSSAHELEASEDTNASQRVTVTATYNGSTSRAEVAVATVETENLEVLPTLWRFNALINDGTVYALILCTLFAVVATWAATPFAGIGAFQLGVAMGWFGGWIPGGIMMVGVFASLFIGFNLAANIDYTVRR